MLEPQSTDLTIFLGKGWNHASTVLRSSEKDKRTRTKFTVVGLPPRVDEKSMKLFLKEDQDKFTFLTIQQPSNDLLEMIQKEKPSVVVDVSTTQQTEKTLSGTYLHSDYFGLTLQQEDGSMVQIPKTTIRFMRVVYANNKPVPQMLHALTVHLNMSTPILATDLTTREARLDYFFNGVAAEVTHVFEMNFDMRDVKVHSYLNLNMLEPSYQLENVNIRLIEDYREKVDSSRQPAYEEEAYQTYSASAPQASPAMYSTRAVTRKQARSIVPAKGNAYAQNKGDEQKVVQQSMQQIMDVDTGDKRVLLEKSREHVFALKTYDLESAKMFFRLEKSRFSFLTFSGFKEDMQPLDARISWDASADRATLFSGTARFYVDGMPLSTDSVAFNPWKLGSEMTIDFPISSFTFGRRLLHSTFDNQEGGRTKKVFRIDLYIAKHEILDPRALYFESLENIGAEAKEVKFIRRVTNMRVDVVQDSLEEGSKIDPYNYPMGPIMTSDLSGSIEPYKNPDTGLYEPGVYKLMAEADNSRAENNIGTMSHFFYEVLY